jgi:List-Bact-rpt repeat protein/flagellar hook capping protein FlgD
VTGAGQSTGYVVGNLRERFNPSGGQASRTLDMGDAGVYAPVAIAAHGVGAAFDLLGTTTTPDHPNVAGSGLNVSKTVNRYWTLTPTGTPALSSYDATFGFGASDVDPGASTASFYVREYDGTWHLTTTGARTATSTQATGLAAFGDFAVGELTQFTLSVTTVGGGSVAKSPDLPTYGTGTTVQLTATAATGWAFSGWSGDASGNTNPLTVTMTGPKSIVATFVDVEPPTAHVLSPNGGEKLIVGNVRTLRWEQSDNVGVETMDIYLSRDGGLTFPDIIVEGLRGGQTTLDWVVTGPGTNDEDDQLTCFIRIAAHDFAGNITSDTSDAGFEIVNVGTTAVNEALPREFSLASPWPNPARGPVQLEYALPTAAPVRLSVIDLQGREVLVLADGAQAPGRYHVTWNGRTSSGAAPAGMYFVRYRTPGKDFVRRVALAR